MFYVGLKDGIPFLTQSEVECPCKIRSDGTPHIILSDEKSPDDGVKLQTFSRQHAEAYIMGLKVIPKRVTTAKK
jgi:hypothetical protein